MMSDLTIVSIVAFVIGGFLGWGLWVVKNRQTRKMQSIMKKPDLLAKKLNAHGKIYDEGHPISIGTKTNEKGKKEIVIDRGEKVVPKSQPSSKIKDSKKATPKRGAKKKKTKGSR